MNWRDLKENGHTVLAGAVSGGLDSCTVTHWLTAKGFDVRCYTVDLAQPDEGEPGRDRATHGRMRRVVGRARRRTRGAGRGPA